MRSIFAAKCLSCLALAGALVSVADAVATAKEPFAIDDSQWKSPEGYDAREARNPAPLPSKETSAPTASNPDSAVSQEYPDDSFRTPLLPGINKGFNVEVESTEDKNIVTEFEMRDGVSLSEGEWKSLPASSATDAGKGDEEENQPLKVRMTYLPSKVPLPLPKAERSTAPRKGHDLMRRLAEQKKIKPKTPEEAAACRALNAYKKQQIDAIQSDRETLKALQDAIKSLGFTKQMQFMVEQGSALSSPVVSTGTIFSIDENDRKN